MLKFLLLPSDKKLTMRGCVITLTTIGIVGCVREKEDRVDILVEQLMSPDPSVQGNAIRELKKMGERAVPALIRTFSSYNYKLTRKAQEILVSIGEPAIPFLVKALEDWNGNVRLAARKTLIEIARRIFLIQTGEEYFPVVSSLIMLLEDSRKPGYARAEAALTLGEIKPFDKIAPSLFKALQDFDPDVRYGAARALSKKSGKVPFSQEQMDLLRRALSDPDKDVQISAAIALGLHGDPASLPVLFEALDEASYEIQWIELGKGIALTLEKDPQMTIRDLLYQSYRSGNREEFENVLRQLIEFVQNPDNSRKAKQKIKDILERWERTDDPIVKQIFEKYKR